MVDTPDPVRAGSSLTYTLDIANNGPSDALNLTLADTLPGLATFESATSPCTHSNGTVNCSLGTLAAGVHRQVTILAKVSQSAPTGNITNQSSISSTTSDPFPGNNSAQTITTVDTQVPTISWVSPGPGGGYYRPGPVVHLETSVSDDVGISRVSFARWDPNLNNGTGGWVTLFTDTSFPYSLDLDTNQIPSDWIEIGVLAYDRAGNDSGGFQKNWIFIFVKRYLFMPFTTK